MSKEVASIVFFVVFAIAGIVISCLSSMAIDLIRTSPGIIKRIQKVEIAIVWVLYLVASYTILYSMYTELLIR